MPSSRSSAVLTTSIPHFTPWDHNWPYGPPTDATPPQVPDLQRDDLTDNPTCSAGSIVECENQVLGEAIPLVGVKDALHYTSARVPGRIAARTLRIPLSGPTIPGSLKRIELDVQVAGQRHRQSFDGAANLQTSFTWDGKDAYGRDVPGRQPVTVDIGYVYDAAFRSPADFEASFGLPGIAGVLGLGLVGTAVLVAVVGVLASVDILLRKPLSTLRSE